MKPFLLSCAAAIFGLAAGLARGDVVLVDQGQAKCAILAPARIMEPDQKLSNPTFRQREAEAQRQRLRESANDLARVGRIRGRESSSHNVFSTPDPVVIPGSSHPRFAPRNRFRHL